MKKIIFTVVLFSLFFMFFNIKENLVKDDNFIEIGNYSLKNKTIVLLRKERGRLIFSEGFLYNMEVVLNGTSHYFYLDVLDRFNFNADAYINKKGNISIIVEKKDIDNSCKYYVVENNKDKLAVIYKDTDGEYFLYIIPPSNNTIENNDLYLENVINEPSMKAKNYYFEIIIKFDSYLESNDNDYIKVYS